MSVIEENIEVAMRALRNDIIRKQHELAKAIIGTDWSRGTMKERTEEIFDCRQATKALENHETREER